MAANGIVLSLALAALVPLAGCAGRFGGTTPPSEPRLRLDVGDVRWPAGGPNEIALAIENSGGAPVSIAAPTSAGARVDLLQDGDQICRWEGPPPDGAAPVVQLGPGERRVMVVRLEGCHAPGGEYRYQASYEVPDARGADWSGRLGPEVGRLFVERSEATIELPAARRSVSPPEHADAPVAAPHPSPAVRPGPVVPGAAPPPVGPAEMACVDRELARLGLNAFGDPAGTIYSQGPPQLASEVERTQSILERYPDIRTICGMPR